jgi:hypothetical protein
MRVGGRLYIAAQGEGVPPNPGNPGLWTVVLPLRCDKSGIAVCEARSTPGPATRTEKFNDPPNPTNIDLDPGMIVIPISPSASPLLPKHSQQRRGFVAAASLLRIPGSSGRTLSKEYSVSPSGLQYARVNAVSRPSSRSRLAVKLWLSIARISLSLGGWLFPRPLAAQIAHTRLTTSAGHIASKGIAIFA